VLKKELQRVDRLIKKSELKNRMSPKYSGEAHFALYKLLSSLNSLAHKTASVDHVFQDESGTSIHPKDYERLLQSKLKNIEESFYADLEAYSENQKNNPRNYPFASAFPVLQQLFLESYDLVKDASRMPPLIVNASLQEIGQLADHDFEINTTSQTLLKNLKNNGTCTIVL